MNDNGRLGLMCDQKLVKTSLIYHTELKNRICSEETARSPLSQSGERELVYGHMVGRICEEVGFELGVKK